MKQKRDEGSRQAGKRQFRLVAVRGMPYATSGLNRGKARHSLTLGLARLNREPRLRGGYGWTKADCLSAKGVTTPKQRFDRAVGP